MADWTPPKLGAPVWLGIAANDVSRGTMTLLPLPSSSSSSS
jgi:hypothetical protein